MDSAPNTFELMRPFDDELGFRRNSACNELRDASDNQVDENAANQSPACLKAMDLLSEVSTSSYIDSEDGQPYAVESTIGLRPRMEDATTGS